jgi:hypothetical protein
VRRQVGPHALLADRYISDKGLKAAMESDAAVAAAAAMAEDSDMNVNELLGQYLVSLRCSYATQFHEGLLSALPYRQIIDALSVAVDHVNDAKGEMTNVVSEDQFEWRQLEEMGFLELPLWLKCVSGVGCKRWTEEEYARRVEIVLAVMKAHEDTRQEALAMLNVLPSRFREILQASETVKERAETRYADLRNGDPEICRAVRTRQTCKLVLQRMRHEFESLRSTGQIGDADVGTYEVQFLPPYTQAHIHTPRTHALAFSQIVYVDRYTTCHAFLIHIPPTLCPLLLLQGILFHKRMHFRALPTVSQALPAVQMPNFNKNAANQAAFSEPITHYAQPMLSRVVTRNTTFDSARTVSRDSSFNSDIGFGMQQMQRPFGAYLPQNAFGRV